MKKILILYFSGVGATKHVAQKIQTQLSHDFQVDLHSVEDSSIKAPNNYDALVIGTPVFHASPAVTLIKYFENIPKQTNQIPAFIFNTKGLWAGNTNRILAKTLQQKNINAVLEKTYKSPASDGALLAPYIKNFFEFEKNIDKKINQDSTDFNSILNSDDFSVRLPAVKLSGIINAPNKLAGKLTTFNIYLNQEKCIKCDKCINNCPEDALIKDTNGYPKFVKRNCINCYRCIHSCPKLALSLSKRHPPKKVLKY